MSFAGAQKAARTDLEDATVQRVGVGVDSALALLLDVNVIQMFVATAGSGKINFDDDDASWRGMTFFFVFCS